MSNSLIATAAAATELAQLHADAVDDASRPVLAANSRAIYEAMLNKFDRWATAHGYSRAVPIDQRIISAWVLDLAAAGTAVTSIGVAIAAVKWTHEQSGHVFERSIGLNNTLKRIRRDYATTPDQAAPLKGMMLADMLATVDKSALGMRDAAMLALAYIFALRRSEMAAIDLAPSDSGNSLTLTPEAVTLTIRRSKTSQEAPETISVPRDANPRAVGAIERWIRWAQVAPGSPLLRAVSPMGTMRQERLSPDMAGRAIKRAVGRYLECTGMDPAAARAEAAKYGGHSGRVGFITTAIENGATHENVAKVSRHRPGSKMIGRYSAQADQLRTAPHRLPGVGV